MSRVQIIGLDKPQAAALRSAADPLKTLREQAAQHEEHRLESVAEITALVALMAVKGAISGREVVVVGRAVFQFGTGVRKDNTQAAHCLPGQLEFNARPLHTLPDWNPAFLKERGMRPLPLSSKLRNLCGRTDAVDGSVNQMDSLLEIMGGARGLKPIFGRSVSQVLQRLSQRAPAGTQNVCGLVEDSMERYRLGAAYACEERIGELAARERQAGTKDDSESIHRKIIVAEEYLRTVQDGAFVPECLTSAGFQLLVRDVVAQ
jgi:hypothetical protein